MVRRGRARARTPQRAGPPGQTQHPALQAAAQIAFLGDEAVGDAPAAQLPAQAGQIFERPAEDPVKAGPDRRPGVGPQGAEPVRIGPVGLDVVTDLQERQSITLTVKKAPLAAQRGHAGGFPAGVQPCDSVQGTPCDSGARESRRSGRGRRAVEPLRQPRLRLPQPPPGVGKRGVPAMAEGAGQRGPQPFTRRPGQPLLDAAVQWPGHPLAELAQPVPGMAQHPAAHQPVAGPDDITQKIRARRDRRQPAGVLERQAQRLLEKPGDGVAPGAELLRVRVQQTKQPPAKYLAESQLVF